ncbi:hypothetical protein [Labrys sp. 22185]
MHAVGQSILASEVVIFDLYGDPLVRMRTWVEEQCRLVERYSMPKS